MILKEKEYDELTDEEREDQISRTEYYGEIMKEINDRKKR